MIDTPLIEKQREKNPSFWWLIVIVSVVLLGVVVIGDQTTSLNRRMIFAEKATGVDITSIIKGNGNNYAVIAVVTDGEGNKVNSFFIVNPQDSQNPKDYIESFILNSLGLEGADAEINWKGCKAPKKKVRFNNLEDVTVTVRSSVGGFNRKTNYNGSGTLININGKIYVLTASHILREYYRSSNKDGPIKIFIGKEQRGPFPAKIVKVNLDYLNYQKGPDLALLSVDLPPSFPATKIATDEPRVGDKVCAVGNLGEEGGGKIHCTVFKLEYVYDLETHPGWSLGYSGGPLFNEKGEVVGVLSSSSGSSGVESPQEGQAVRLEMIRKFLGIR